jgi:hypothetical protein
VAQGRRGLLQYFENRGTSRLAETLTALHALGAKCQRRVLERASEILLKKPRARIETAELYVETALEGEFDLFDTAYFAW